MHVSRAHKSFVTTVNEGTEKLHEVNILSLPYKPPSDPIDPFIGRVIYEAFPSRFGWDGLKYHLAAGGPMIVSRCKI